MLHTGRDINTDNDLTKTRLVPHGATQTASWKILSLETEVNHGENHRLHFVHFV